MKRADSGVRRELQGTDAADLLATLHQVTATSDGTIQVVDSSGDLTRGLSSQTTLSAVKNERPKYWKKPSIVEIKKTVLLRGPVSDGD